MFKPAVFGALFITAGLLSSCASLQNNRQHLQSAAISLTSIAAEGELFTQFVIEGHATASYTRAHPRYLEELADSASREVLGIQGDGDLRGPRDQLLQLANELQVSIGNLSAAAGSIQTLEELGQRFADLAQSAKQVGRTL